MVLKTFGYYSRRGVLLAKLWGTSVSKDIPGHATLVLNGKTVTGDVYLRRGEYLIDITERPRAAKPKLKLKLADLKKPELFCRWHGDKLDKDGKCTGHIRALAAQYSIPEYHSDGAIGNTD